MKHKKSPFLFLFLAALLSAQAGEVNPAFSSAGWSGIRFTENKGQIADMEGRLRPDIRYTADAGSAKLYFMSDRISYVFCKMDEDAFIADMACNAGIRGAENDGAHSFGKVEIYRLDLHFPGCNRNVKITPLEELDGYFNYYLGHCPDGVLHVRGYKRILYENLWNNIDMVFASSKGRVKYEFIVKPGGDPSDIRMLYEGATSINMGGEGNLRIETPLGAIEDEAPVTMQDGIIIPSGFRVRGNIVGIETAGFDGTKPLLIDPWATYYGGSAYESMSCVRRDGSGNYVIGGDTQSSNFPVSNAWQSSPGGQWDMFVLKITPSQTVLWATYYGGSDGDANMSIATGANGVITAAGYTYSSNFPVSANAYQSSLSGTGLSRI